MPRHTNGPRLSANPEEGSATPKNPDHFPPLRPHLGPQSSSCNGCWSCLHLPGRSSDPAQTPTLASCGSLQMSLRTWAQKPGTLCGSRISSLNSGLTRCCHFLCGPRTRLLNPKLKAQLSVSIWESKTCCHQQQLLGKGSQLPCRSSAPPPLCPVSPLEQTHNLPQG